MRVEVEGAACTGHGRCYALAPEVFAPDDDGHCEVVHDEVPADLHAGARTAVGNCPEAALRVLE
jgi:ferredoxin